MRDWTIDYVLHVLEARDWTMNRLAEEAGLAASTINRPIRDPDYPHGLARKTVRKIAAASGIDPAPFVPAGMAEEKHLFAPSRRPDTYEARILAALDAPPGAEGAGPMRNDIRIATSGTFAQIVATIDREGLESLRKKLDALEKLLDG